MNEEQIARDTLAIYHYGRSYNELPDDGPEQDWIATEATQKIEAHTITFNIKQAWD